MHVHISPRLDGIASERLKSFAIRLADSQLAELDLRKLADAEGTWARQSKLLNGQTRAYEAAARLLADLRLLKWTVRADSCGIELESPPHPRFTASSPEVIRAAKESVKKELSSARAGQFTDPLVREFVQNLEDPPKGSRRRSIRTLIADGQEVFGRLIPVIRSLPTPTPAVLDQAVKPYLQLVPGEGEPNEFDQFTGIPLGEVWRYFRFTWSIPNTPIPGRQLFYLVRDAAHPTHAIIGIAALGNSPLISPLRDRVIGWTSEAFLARLSKAARERKTEELGRLLRYLVAQVDSAVEHINPAGLVSKRELAAPTTDLIARLQRRADEFSSRRADALREVAEAATAGVPLAAQEAELPDFVLPPVSKLVLELEGRKAPDECSQTLARRLLVAKKRAFELARLMRARIALATYQADLLEPAKSERVLQAEDFVFAVNTTLTAAKSERIGTSVLEITTCGAVAPYNYLLGGKLVALLLLSPEVADDYRKRYEDRPSIISSQLKNAHRTKDCTLAWLNTTSLYSLGSSQYERLRLPAGTIASDQPELRYWHIGDTEGYGTVQFSESTVLAVQAALEEQNQYKAVNSIFGEGFSPKFRKLRDGMDTLGFNSTILMRHDQPRRMYAVPMWPGANSFLRGETTDLPSYIAEPGKFRDASQKIVNFWRVRWLASRLNHGPALEALRNCRSWVLSEELQGHPINEKSLKSRPRKPVERAPVDPSSSAAAKTTVTKPQLAFWKELAHAGSETCADEILPEWLDKIHVQQPLDDFLIGKVKLGYSLVLTGNAGDGKTHLLRRLESELRAHGAVVEPDATAAMKADDVSSIIERWKKTHRQKKPFCIAANEYPLHLLRSAGKGFAPLEEVDRQCGHRLAYTDKPEPDEDARENVLVLDLGLRNPLAKGFAGALLARLLSREEIAVEAKAEPAEDLAWNLAHLSNKTVRDRLLHLLSRLASAGHRATVRELWIWVARLLFGSGHESNKPVRSPERWYSNRLFQEDGRFPLSQTLRLLADPARYSHPRWDYRLESGQVKDGWELGPPTLLRIDQANFTALKRLFYFEHHDGQKALEIDGTPGGDFLKVLGRSGPLETTFKQTLIQSINASYSPVLSSEMTTRLYLWIGHRYHEQPSHGYIANQSISESGLELVRPRLPKRLVGAFDYQPDHLILQYPGVSNVPVRLRVDYHLFVALERLRQGLPRQLQPDRELNRVDAFIEQLRRLDISKTREFFIHNNDERATAKVTLSADHRSYETVTVQ
jgi:hypothetical protein